MGAGSSSDGEPPGLGGGAVGGDGAEHVDAGGERGRVHADLDAADRQPVEGDERLAAEGVVDDGEHAGGAGERERGRGPAGGGVGRERGEGERAVRRAVLVVGGRVDRQPDFAQRRLVAIVGDGAEPDAVGGRRQSVGGESVARRLAVGGG